MTIEIDDNALLTSLKFRILPNQNRYQAFASDGNKDELLIEGLLEQLTQHLPQVKDFCVGTSKANFKLQWPRNSTPAAWFSKSTFRRFLNIVADSTKLFNEIKAIEDEMSQLEAARKFHLSVYSQAEFKGEVLSSDPSKNELLRAMDSRMKALREDLAASLEQAAGSFCCINDISHMVNCCHSLGATALKRYLNKYLELNQIMLNLDEASENENPTFTNDAECDYETVTLAKGAASMLTEPVVHVQYASSPAKAATLERDNTSDNEDSSDNSVVDATERSRSVARAATPRRSASPMRRVQIARVGSRRAPTIGIKSLSYLPGRERTLNSTNDEPSNSSDGEVSERLPRKTETNEQRISVRAAISLFETKQREDNVDILKKSSGGVPKSVKPVLRKWNSCTEQSHVQSSAEAVPEKHSFSSFAGLQDSETQKVDRHESEPNKDDVNNKAGELDAATQTRNSLESTMNIPGNSMTAQAEESAERLTASAKWNQQKEAELNMLMKMIEEKPIKPRRSVGNKSIAKEHKGGFSDDYQKKRDEKLRGEGSAKQAETESQLTTTQKIIEKGKTDMPSKKGRRQSLSKPTNSVAPQHAADPKTKVPKDTKSLTAKRTAKPSSLPTTRKSWPSTPPLLATGISPVAVSSNKSAQMTVKTTGSKSQSPKLISRSSPKVEKAPLEKNAKGLQTKSKTSSKGPIVVHQQPWARDTKPTKPKSLVSSEDFSDMVPVKTELPCKGAKKSSVIPVEPKPFLRRVSKVGSAVVPASTISKSSPRSMGTVRKSGNNLPSREKEVVQSPEQVDKHEIKNFTNDRAKPALVSEVPVRSDERIVDPETPRKDTANDSVNLVVVEEEETTISPSAWVEVDESHDSHIMPIPIDDNEVQFAYPTSVTSLETASPRMRQSLSQMLQEESNELDNTEWGNAEHSSVIYSKDAPKGFKRLLKFARKSKGDANSSGWSSPSIFSEGDDDADDYKSAVQRNADNPLRKANYQTKNTSQLKPLNEGLERKSYSRKLAHDVSNGAQFLSYEAGGGHDFVGVSGTKSSRSFFSLSAFRGSK